MRLVVVDQSKKDLAHAYEVMMGLAAWKHFETNILNRIEQQAMKDEDAVFLDELTPAKIAECRGRRKAIDKIKSDIQFIVEEVR